MNNNIGKLWRKVLRDFVSGKGFSRLPGRLVELWTIFWTFIDRNVGRFFRMLLRCKTRTNPKKVMFLPQESKYCCNPKYICEELRKQCPDVEIVWRVPANGLDSGVPEGLGTARLNTFDYFKQIFSSKVIVANSFLYLGQPFSLKKDQILIQTWHGSLGIKRHDKNAIKDTPLRVKALEHTGELTTYCISNSSLETGSLRGTYWPNTPILEYGHARNDLFFPRYADERKKIRSRLMKEWELPADTKIAMYAPTFRDGQGFECYNVDFQRVGNALKQRFGGNWCVLLRYHPSLLKVYKKRGITLQSSADKTPEAIAVRELARAAIESPRKSAIDALSAAVSAAAAASQNQIPVINVTQYLDMQELIAVTDVAITDYSSWIYDFVLLRRPGFIYATDIEQYNSVDRGFYYPLEETPFPIATDNHQLENNILAFDEDKYAKDVEQFLIDKGCIEDGHAAERVVALIKKELGLSADEPEPA